MNKSKVLKEIVSEFADNAVRKQIHFDKRKEYQRIRIYFRVRTIKGLTANNKQQIVDDLEAAFGATHIDIRKKTPCCEGCLGHTAKYWWSVTFRYIKVK
jgi:heterodisulfide reductase subunit B